MFSDNSSCPLRNRIARGIGVTKLLPADQAGEQIDLFDFLESPNMAISSTAKMEKQERLEAAVDSIRKRFGHATITLGNQQNEEIGIDRIRQRDD